MQDSKPSKIIVTENPCKAYFCSTVNLFLGCPCIQISVLKLKLISFMSVYSDVIFSNYVWRTAYVCMYYYVLYYVLCMYDRIIHLFSKKKNKIHNNSLKANLYENLKQITENRLFKIISDGCMVVRTLKRFTHLGKQFDSVEQT